MKKPNFILKNDYMYETLKDEIVEGRLRPGERIVISDLAAKYNVSPMPVREAINRLQQDGFVEVVPHVGSRVSSFDINKHREIMQIRIELEPIATRLSIPFISAKALTKLEKLIREMEVCLQKKDYMGYSRVNREFHLTIYTACPNKSMFELIKSLWAKSEYSRRIFSELPERNEESLKEHKALVEAIKEKDAEKGAEIIRRQKVTGTAMHLKYYDEMIARMSNEN